MAPAGKTPKTKSRRRMVKGAHGVLPDWEEVVREDVIKDTMQIKYRSRESVAKGTVQTRTDLLGEPPMETRAGSQERHPRSQGAGWKESEEQTHTSAITYLAQRERAGKHWQ